MYYKLYLEEMKNIQRSILDFLDHDDNSNEECLFPNFNLEKLNSDSKLFKTKEILYLIVSIANNHHRKTNFFDKIDQILLSLKQYIIENYDHSEIFKIFKSNKRILLFLIKEKMLTINQSISFEMTKLPFKHQNYLDYFYYEITSSFKSDSISIDQNKFKLFDDKRKTGENDDYLCSLIRQDSVKEFIAYVNKKNLSLSKHLIYNSIFETNEFLTNEKYHLIEYAAFYGSLQIFQYLRINGVELRESLWLHAIHGNNPEIIHLLEEDHIKAPYYNYQNSFMLCYIEAIKCHHNDIAHYIYDNYLNSNDKIKVSKYYKYLNYEFFNLKIDFKNTIYYVLKNDIVGFAESLFKDNENDVNYQFNFQFFE